MANAQTNIAIEKTLNDIMGAYCSARGMSKGYFISAAILTLLEMDSDDRDAALVNLERYDRSGGASALRAKLVVESTAEDAAQKKRGRRRRTGEDAA